MKNKNKIIFLGGGLGNNLFQIAYGEFLSKKGYNIQYNLFLTQKNILTTLLGWSIHRNEITNQLLKDKNVTNKINLIDIIFLIFSFIKKRIANEKLYNISESEEKRYFGYAVQGPHLNKEIFDLLSLKIRNSFQNKIKNNVNNTIMHIRRGDFSREYSLTDDYYIQALKYLKPQNNVIVVTDDSNIITHVKENIFQNAKLSDGKSMVDDFFTIFNAKNIIMSNSTFCYWACILGNAEKVTYPSKISTNQGWFFNLNNTQSKEISCNFLSEMVITK